MGCEKATGDRESFLDHSSAMARELRLECEGAGAAHPKSKYLLSGARVQGAGEISVDAGLLCFLL